MSDWTLDAQHVTAGGLVVPRVGVWVADLEVVTDAAPAARVSLTVGEATWWGTVVRGGVSEGRWRGRVVGGAGGLHRRVVARQYQSTPRRMVVAAILAEAGEALAPTASGLADLLTTWARLAEPAAHALGRLVSVWRALPDGTITTDPWPAVEAPEPELVEELPELTADVVAVDGLDVVPGMTLRARAVTAVAYSLRGPSMRAMVSYDA